MGSEKKVTLTAHITKTLILNTEADPEAEAVTIVLKEIAESSVVDGADKVEITVDKVEPA